MNLRLLRTWFFLGLMSAGILTVQLPAQTASNPACKEVNGQCDDLAPDLLSITYPSSTVNAAAQNQNPTFTLTATAIDPLSGTVFIPPVAGGIASGVARAYIQFGNQPCNGNASVTGSAWAYLFPQAGVPGATQTLTGTLYFGVNAPSGSYYACSARVDDQLGNSHQYSMYGAQTSALLSSLPPIQVIGCTVCSAPPPVPNGLSATPEADVTSSSATFSVTINITDSNTGLDPSQSYVSLYYSGPTFSYSWNSRQSNPYHLVRLSGDQNNGVYQAQVTVPRSSMAGKWMIAVYLCDMSSNCKYYTPSDLSDLGLVSSITVKDSNPDTTPPQFVSLSMTQSNSTVSNGLVSPEVPIAITLNLTDAAVTGAASGIGYDGYSGCNPYMYVTSQNQYSGSDKSSIQYQYVGFQPSGANLPTSTVTWTGTLAFPKYSEIGQWNVTIYTCDRVGNYSTFTGTAGLGPANAYMYVLYKTQTAPVRATGTVSDPSGAAVTVPQGLNPSPTPNSPPVADATVSISVTPVPPSAACDQNPPASQCASPPGFYNGFKSTGSPYVSYTFADSQGANPLSHANFQYPGTSIVLPGVVQVPPAIVGSQDPSLTLWSIDGGVSHATLGCLDASGAHAPLNPTIINTHGDVMFSHVCTFSTFFVMRKTGVPGDVTGDGAATCSDVSLVRSVFGTRSGQRLFDARADVNNDGIVNILDLTFVLKQVPNGSACH